MVDQHIQSGAEEGRQLDGLMSMHKPNIQRMLQHREEQAQNQNRFITQMHQNQMLQNIQRDQQQLSSQQNNGNRQMDQLSQLAQNSMMSAPIKPKRRTVNPKVLKALRSASDHLLNFSKGII